MAPSFTAPNRENGNEEAETRANQSAASSASSSAKNAPAGNTMTSQGQIDEYASTFKPDWRFFVAFASLCVIVLMAALDATSLSVAIPKITSQLNGSAIEGFWSGTSFLLTSTVLQPVYGSFSDIFGRKTMIYLALVLFTVGAIVAAVAQDMTTLLAGRVVQGSGGGGIYVLSEIVITDLVPLRFRGNFFSLIAAMWAIGSVSGPVIGGAFSEDVSWRWIFWINLPFIGIGAPMIVMFLLLHFKTSSLGQKLARIDWVGTLLFIAATTGFLIPVTWGGVNFAWTSWHTLVPLLVCGVGLVFFIVWEERFASDPLIRMRIFKNRTAAATYFSDTIHGLILWCALYCKSSLASICLRERILANVSNKSDMPLYYQAVKGQSPIISGVDLFPTTFTVAPCAIFVGAAITKLGVYRWAIWTGWTLTTLGRLSEPRL